MGWTYEVGLVLIVWVGPKINGLDLGNGLGPNKFVIGFTKHSHKTKKRKG